MAATTAQRSRLATALSLSADLKPRHRSAALSALSLAVVLGLGGCASMNGSPETTAALSPDPSQTASAADGSRAKTELEQATEYWGKAYQKEPRNKVAGLSYAKNLKAGGQKQAAMSVLQQLSLYYGNDREVASEYGRLALEFDQAGLAAQVLAAADDPAKPDWRVISARGAAAAKLGQYADAVPHFERALQLVPANASVMNNLAMAYAANGQADRAEELLRTALEQRPDDAKIRQNLTIVLGLRGQHEQAKTLALTGAGAADATANALLIQKLVPSSQPAPVAQVAAGATPAAAKSAKKAKPAVTETSSVTKPAATTPASATAAPKGGFSDADADALIQRAIAGGSTPAR
jgi:Flp pilus assembly protein TadD